MTKPESPLAALPAERLKPASAGRTLHVYAGHPGANGAAIGARSHPFTAIQSALLAARPGDVVMVHAGIYRERIAPPRSGEPGKPIAVVAAPDEQVIVRGSVIWSGPWYIVDPSHGIYASEIDDHLFAGATQHPLKTPLARARPGLTTGQLYIDGQPLAQVPDAAALEHACGAWAVDADGKTIRVRLADGSSPRTHLVEITVLDRLFAPRQRGLNHIHIQGILFEHCANQFPSGFYCARDDHRGHPQAGAVSCRSGSNWVIRACTIRLATGIGLDCGGEGGFDPEGTDDRPFPPQRGQIGGHVIEGNTICDNGACGIACAGSTGTAIRHNIIERNNRLGFTAPETGGIKVHFFYEGIIEANLVRDNDASGIWLDNEWYDTRVTRNIVLNNRGQGIFVEMGDGPCLVDHNIVAETRSGDGIYLHDATGVTMAHNLLIANSHFGIHARVVSNRRGRNAAGDRVALGCRRLQVIGNLFVDNYRGHLCLPDDGAVADANQADHNLLASGVTWQWHAPGWLPFHAAYHEASVTGVDPAANGRDPGMTLEQWRQRTARDMHSRQVVFGNHEVENGAVTKAEIYLAPLALRLTLGPIMDQTLRAEPALAGITHDFLGHAFGATVRPGPIQHSGTFQLWPVPKLR